MNWIPLTKLYRPKAGTDTLQRPRLLEALHRAVIGNRLTLISAQAGAGKTTLAAALADREPQTAMAWIALDEGDNYVASFLSLLVTAVDRLLPDCPQNAATLLIARPDSDVRHVIGLFINDLLSCQPDDFVLVLDDLHLIEDAECVTALDYLLEHLPPMLHLLACTRQDPPLALSLLRARGQLAEFRMDQLRFAPEETATLLHDLAGLELRADELAALQTRTEGWVTALRLLALSVDQMADVERVEFVHNLSGNQQFIFDYLADEVVRQLPEDLQTFMLETTVLGEMTPDLCRAVTGRADAHAVLDDLVGRNLFVSRSETLTFPIYRYHALLHQFLQMQLQRTRPDYLPELHRRAARALSRTPRAVDHLIAAGAWDEAADLLEQLMHEQTEQNYISEHLVQSIRRLPKEVVAYRPWLVAAQGLLLLQRGHADAGRPFAEQAATQFAQRGDDLGRLYMLLALGTVTAGEGWEQILQQVEPMITARGEEIPARWRVSFYINTCWWNIYALDWPAAEEHLQRAVDLAVASGEAGALYILVKNDFFTLFFSTAATAAVIRLEAALQRLRAGDLLAQYGLLNIRLCRHWFQGHVDEAEAAAMEAQAISKQLGGFGYADAAAIFVLFCVQWARGELDALAMQLEGIIAVMPHDVARNDVLGLLALVRWQQGRAGAVRQALQEMEAHTHFARHQVNNDIVYGLLAGIDGDLISADRHLRGAIDLQRRVGHSFSGNAHLMLVIVYWQAGERHTALRELDFALDEWERKGLPGVVLQSGRKIIPPLEAAVAANVHADFSKRCLDAFGVAGRPRRIPVPGTGQTLTPREAEVLALIVKGKSNPEIAAELVVTERTVKSHVTNILSKMGVTSRTEAAVMARDLDLL